MRNNYHGRPVFGWTLNTLQPINIARDGSLNADPPGANVPLECDIGQGCPQTINAYSPTGTRGETNELQDGGGTNNHNDDERTRQRARATRGKREREREETYHDVGSGLRASTMELT